MLECHSLQTSFYTRLVGYHPKILQALLQSSIKQTNHIEDQRHHNRILSSRHQWQHSSAQDTSRQGILQTLPRKLGDPDYFSNAAALLCKKLISSASICQGNEGYVVYSIVYKIMDTDCVATLLISQATLSQEDRLYMTTQCLPFRAD